MTIQTPMTEQQVLIHLMLAMAAADEAISDAELSRVERLIDFLPVFENFPPEDLDIVTDSFVELMSVEEGLDSLMTLLANTLPDELHETAYALAVEIAAADLTVT
ncbi:MAG: tellurite resistance TerB family protein, partial [Pseudomonadota bacterium]|nr:tellurite resistance TerB family protein [Pseudomonadota bacterium]